MSLFDRTTIWICLNIARNPTTENSPKPWKAKQDLHEGLLVTCYQILLAFISLTLRVHQYSFAMFLKCMLLEVTLAGQPWIVGEVGAGSCISRSRILVLSSEIFSVGCLEHIVWMFCVSFLLEWWYVWVFLLVVVVLFVLILCLIQQNFFCTHTCWSLVMHPHETLPPVLKGQDSFWPSPCLFVLSLTRFLHSMVILCEARLMCHLLGTYKKHTFHVSTYFALQVKEHLN